LRRGILGEASNVPNAKTIQTFVNLSPELLAEVRALAERDNRTLSGYIRNLLAWEAREAARARRDAR
jgi:hypothetical protein